MMMLTSATGKFNYEESKVFAPGNLRRDAKKPRSFRMLCSDSNPTTDHDVSFVSSRDASITRCYFRPIGGKTKRLSRGRGPEEGVLCYC
ncbi:hypothetical protein LINPERHAP1_LOCUS31220 [Linum perenne]